MREFDKNLTNAQLLGLRETQKPSATESRCVFRIEPRKVCTSGRASPFATGKSRYRGSDVIYFTPNIQEYLYPRAVQKVPSQVV